MNSPNLARRRTTRSCDWKCARNLRLALFVLLSLLVSESRGFFTPGKEYVYEYEASASSGVFVPSKAQSSWGFSGQLVVQAGEDAVFLQLRSLKSRVSNGAEEPETKQPDSNLPDGVAEELQKVFRLQYRSGLAENFSVEASEPAWASNIKRSIAGILQLDLPGLESEVAFHSVEINHYGQCTIEYVATTRQEAEGRRIVRKSVDPRTCTGHPHRTWSNVPRTPCPSNSQNPVLKSSERFYEISRANNATTLHNVNATGEIYVQPFQSLGEAHFLVTSQQLKLLTEKEQQGPTMKSSDLQGKPMQHELPADDLTQGRGSIDKDAIFKSISKLLDRLSQRLENPGLDSEIDNLHNTTISQLFHHLAMLDRADLRAAFNGISGTSYKEETVRNIFLELLPQVGTTEAALFVLELIQSQTVSDITAIQLLSHLPFHVRKPDVHLLLGLQPLLNLDAKIAPEVQHTGILTFGTLIYKTCLLFCPYEMLDDYVKLYLDKLTEHNEYEKKMVWLEGLSNIQLGRVVEFLEPIASGSSGESRHLRVLAAWASLPTAPLRPDVIYPVYWPILVNRSEHLEMRVAALNLLIVSSPTPSRIISLYWYLKNEPSRHLYNFFYTTLKSMERTNFPCYTHLGGIAAQFARILKRSEPNEHVLTGNYLFDYQDSKRHFGSVIHGIVIANALTNVPEVSYVTLNSHGSGLDLNHVSLYVKAEGFLHAASTNIDGAKLPNRIEDILKLYKFNTKTSNTVHLEIIARVQQKAVLCLHFNQTNLMKAFEYLLTLQHSSYHVYQNMEFHVNQQRVHVPLIVESIQPTDLGTTAKLVVSGMSLFSMRGNFTHIPNGRNNHVILRTSIHGTESIENYNPLSDLWHGAVRSQSIHGYMPINITFGFQEKFFFSYNTPAEKLRAGLTGHVRTVTKIDGPKLKTKLDAICPTCQQLHTVKRLPNSRTRTSDLFSLQAAELGGSLGIRMFDCEERISTEGLMITDILSSHQSNSQIWPMLESLLIGLHVFDYVSYVPPVGSCGIEAYVEPISSAASEVKFEYIKHDKYHMLALSRRNLNKPDVQEQWNIAIAYDVTSWLSDTLKIKATKSSPGDKVLKICLEADRETPWDWDFLSIKPSEPSSIKLNIVWGMADSAKGKCVGSSLLINLVGEVTNEQIVESKKNVWPYNECNAQAKGKTFVPYTDACYEVSREMSTLRKYKIAINHNNLPASLLKFGNRLKAFYEMVGGDNSRNTSPDQIAIVATFEKGASSGTMLVNDERMPTFYDGAFVNNVLFRSRIHKYMDNAILKSLFSTCVLTPEKIRSSHNVSHAFEKDAEKLILARCDNRSPEFAISAVNKNDFVEIKFNDENEAIVLSSENGDGLIYNHEKQVAITKNFEFEYVGSLSARMDQKTIDLVYGDILLFLHWSQDQVLLFYPNYIQEFTCGYCTLESENVNGLYEKL